MADSPSCGDSKMSKVEGYDEWDIQQAAETLTKAKKIMEDEKLHKLAVAYIANDIEKGQEAIAGEKVEAKVRAKLKSTFKGKG